MQFSRQDIRTLTAINPTDGIMTERLNLQEEHMDTDRGFIISFSCGKDSNLAFYRAVCMGYKPRALVVMYNEKEGRSWFHGVTDGLLEEVSKSLGLPLYKVPSDGKSYHVTLEEALKRAAADTGATLCVFGDIDIEDHKVWCTERASNAGLEPLFPLWQQDREALVHEFVDAGFKAVIKIVDTTQLSEAFLGKEITKELAAAIKNAGADPCGENGEYHSMVYDGPIYRFPIAMETGDKFMMGHHAILDIK
jgi:diphthine-ammonia ligase